MGSKSSKWITIQAIILMEQLLHATQRFLAQSRLAIIRPASGETPAEEGLHSCRPFLLERGRGFSTATRLVLM